LGIAGYLLGGDVRRDVVAHEAAGPEPADPVPTS